MRKSPRIFARERGRLRAAGKIIGDLDLLIGATALRHDLKLLTNNLAATSSESRA